MRYGYEADPRRMSFLDHLAEFRNMAIHCLLILGAGTAGAWFASGVLLDWVIGGLGIEHVQFLSPMEAFNARFKVALIVGLGGTMPLTSLRLWAFVGPAFRAKERRIALPVAVSATLLFAAGTAFSLRVLTPFMLSFLMGFQTDVAQANLALGPLLSFVLRMSLACAVLFQLPLVLGVTTLVGVTTPTMLWAKWRHAVVGIFILSAIVTPGDGPSQIVLGVPLVILYFVSVGVAWLIARGKRGEELPAKAPAESEDEGPPPPPPPPAPPPSGTTPRAPDERDPPA